MPESETDLYRFWFATHQVRDEYVQKVRLGLKGEGNPENKPTFGPRTAKVPVMALTGWNGQSWVVQGREIIGNLAEKVWIGLMERIDVLLG